MPGPEFSVRPLPYFPRRRRRRRRAAASPNRIFFRPNRQGDGPVLDLASRQASARRLRKVADEQFVRVERAYRVLCDPVKRLVSQYFRTSFFFPLI